MANGDAMDDLKPDRERRCCGETDAVQREANERADDQAPEWFVDGEDRVWVSRDEEDEEC